MEKNYLELDGIVEMKQIMLEINNSINKKLEDKMFPDKDVTYIEIRKYILAYLIEKLGVWKDLGDCLPKGIPISEGKVAEVIIKEV